jgi:hypothetical protein
VIFFVKENDLGTVVRQTPAQVLRTLHSTEAATEDNDF